MNERKYKKNITYFIMAGIFIFIGMIAVIYVNVMQMPSICTIAILLATVGSAVKQMFWYARDKDK